MTDGRRHTDELLIEMHTIIKGQLLPMVAKHDKAIFGNGWPGLRTQVAVLSGAVSLLSAFVVYYLKCIIPSHLR